MNKHDGSRYLLELVSESSHLLHGGLYSELTPLQAYTTPLPHTHIHTHTYIYIHTYIQDIQMEGEKEGS